MEINNHFKNTYRSFSIYLKRNVMVTGYYSKCLLPYHEKNQVE